ANGEEVLESQRQFVRAMRVQAMIAHADAQAGSDPIQNDGRGQGLPAKHEQSSQSAEVQDRQNDNDGPVELLLSMNGADVARHVFSCGCIYTPNLTRICYVVCKTYVISDAKDFAPLRDSPNKSSTARACEVPND